MNSPRLITSLPNTIWDKMHSIANKKGLSVSALARVFIIEKLESIMATQGNEIREWAKSDNPLLAQTCKDILLAAREAEN